MKLLGFPWVNQGRRDLELGGPQCRLSPDVARTRHEVKVDPVDVYRGAPGSGVGSNGRDDAAAPWLRCLWHGVAGRGRGGIHQEEPVQHSQWATAGCQKDRAMSRRAMLAVGGGGNRREARQGRGGSGGSTG